MTESLSSWFKKGRPSLFAALEQACEQIDADVAAELRAKAPSKSAPASSWIDGKEGEDWQWKICEHTEEGAQPVDPPSTSDKLPQWRKKVPLDWKGEYRKLQARWIALNKNYKTLKETCYRYRDERKEFRDETKSLHDLILAAEQKHGIKILDATPQVATFMEGPRAEHHTPDPLQGGSFASDGTENLQEALPIFPSDEPTTARGPTRRVSPDNVNSDSTQGESEGSIQNDLPLLNPNDQAEAIIKAEPSSDGPVFISERCINKRKRDEAEAHTPVARIKTEGGHSSPEMSAHRCDFNPHESIDLGEAAPLIWTPRKHRQMELEASQQAVQSIEAAPQDLAPRTDGYVRAEPPAPPKFDSALTPINVNRKQLQAPATTDSREKPLRRGLAHGIQDLAEDGGIYKRDQNEPMPGRPTARGRLDSMLNSTSVATDSTPLRRRPKRQEGTPTTPQVDLGVPRPRALPFDDNSRTTAKATSFQTPLSRQPLADTTNTLSRATTGASKGKGKPRSPKKAHGSFLRNKPVAELRADDFRINPNANKGHDYAFSEVVRDKEERAKLPGCVDEDCCGPKFRGLAESEYPDDPTKPEWRQAEQKLLEDHLGDYAHRLTGMTRAERKAIWIEARMQQIANKYGKHKHHTARMRSPPGFWQFDFPNTQEIEAEREEAGRREKQKIQERHREAMRPGGRWLFRDE